MRRANKALTLACAGSSPIDSTPLTCGVPDRAYMAEVTLELVGNAEGGMVLFYNHKAFVGIGFTADSMKTYEYSEELVWARAPNTHRRIRVRLTNDHQVVGFEYSVDEGRQWTRHPTRMEVSGFHHNVFGGFLSLQLGVYAAQQGEVVLRDFRYRALS